MSEQKKKPTLAPLRDLPDTAKANRAACLQAKALVMALAAFDSMQLVEPERSECRDMALLFGELPLDAQNAGFSAIVPTWWPDVVHPEPTPQTGSHLRRKAVRDRLQAILDEDDGKAA
jgi:hypothetical protein